MKINGYTLIELLITIAIVSILAGIAAPDFARQLTQQQTRSAANELYTDIYWAKEEAIKRNENVTVGFLSGGWQITTASGTLIKARTLPSQVNSVAGADIIFDSVRGLTGADTVTVSSNAGTVQLRIVALGYADICSNDIGGFRSC